MGKDLYAADLLHIREVVEYTEAKPLPSTQPYVLGCMNLRGEIVQIIDVRKKYGYKADMTKNMALIVLPSQHGLSGLLVDDMLSVSSLSHQKVETNPMLDVSIPREYITDMRLNEHDQIVMLIDLKTMIDQEPLMLPAEPTGTWNAHT